MNAWLDPDNLREKGFSIEEAIAKASTLKACAARLNASNAVAFIVPGRIEVLGKHTDYGGGRTLVCASEQGFCAVASPRNDNLVRMEDPRRPNEAIEFALDPDLAPRLAHWSNYPMTVARRLARNFPGPLMGADVVFHSNLPPAAGMSSSSALVVLTHMILANVNRLSERREYCDNITSNESLAGYLGTIENGQSFGTLTGDKGVGTFGGSEDHTAIICSKPNHAGQFSYCPGRHERSITIPNDYLLAIASSGVVAEKTGAAKGHFNRLSRLLSCAADTGRQIKGFATESLGAMLTQPDACQQLRKRISTTLYDPFPTPAVLDRVEHFDAESNRLVPAAAAALSNNDLASFGSIAQESQELAERLLGTAVPETSFLTRSARHLGAAAASMFGAGFGGSVWALVKSNQAVDFCERWGAKYREAFPQRAAATFFHTQAGPAAFVLPNTPTELT